MLLLPVLFLLFVLSIVWWLWHRASADPRYFRRRSTTPPAESVPPHRPIRAHRKPAWARDELIRMAAAMPSLSCRQLAASFNARFAAGGTSIQRTWVSTRLRQHHHAIAAMRADWRARRHRATRRNRVWALDLTGVTDAEGRLHQVLAVLDHGSRAALALERLPSKSTLQILRVLLRCVLRYGLPRGIRTDNESVFNAKRLDAVLEGLKVQHQTIDRHCPWQNGRVERFFGTLKQKIDAVTIADAVTLDHALASFRAWYNHIRPHQHLQGMTPAVAWSGKKILRRHDVAYRFEAWGGRLEGLYLPP